MADNEVFSMSFEPQSLSEIAQFYGFPVYMAEETQAALQEGGSLLVASIRGAMHWQNPTNALEDSIRIVSESPYEIEAGSDLPYARRRNWGFTGRTDRLGRYFAYDPGAFFMETGMDNARSQILASVEAGAERALQRMQQGG